MKEIHIPTISEFERMAEQLGYEKIVRCKDCKHRLAEELEEGLVCCKEFMSIVNKNDYCSYGELGGDDNK